MPESRPPILIVDYGVGNIKSVQKALSRLGYASELSDNPDSLRVADRVILPGVGAFGKGLAHLTQKGWIDPLQTFLSEGRALLGICLGFQLLFDQSTEHGQHQGLGFFSGQIVEIPQKPGLKIPHMGWNKLTLTQSQHPIFEGLSPDPHVYFVHSYYAAISGVPSWVLATTDYGAIVPAIVGKGRVFATQFHPEKSGKVGLKLLQQILKFWELDHA